MKFTLFTADTCGNEKNCVYPHMTEIDTPAALAAAVTHDHTGGKFKGGYRSKDNFEWSDCLLMDVDNDQSDNPADWVDEKKLLKDFGDMQMAIVPSRHDMQEKDGKAARPKKHVLFAIEKTEDAVRYAAIKAALQKKYPYFDGNALDAARFMFGSEVKPENIIWNDGWLTIDDELVGDNEDLEDLLPDRFKEIPAGVT